MPDARHVRLLAAARAVAASPPPLDRWAAGHGVNPTRHLRDVIRGAGWPERIEVVRMDARGEGGGGKAEDRGVWVVPEVLPPPRRTGGVARFVPPAARPVRTTSTREE